MFDAMLMSENKLVRFIAHRYLSDCNCDLGNNYAYIVKKYGFSRHAYLDLKSHIVMIKDNISAEELFGEIIRELRYYTECFINRPIPLLTISMAKSVIETISVS